MKKLFMPWTWQLRKPKVQPPTAAPKVQSNSSANGKASDAKAPPGADDILDEGIARNSADAGAAGLGKKPAVKATGSKPKPTRAAPPGDEIVIREHEGSTGEAVEKSVRKLDAAKSPKVKAIPTAPPPKAEAAPPTRRKVALPARPNQVLVALQGGKMRITSLLAEGGKVPLVLNKIAPRLVPLEQLQVIKVEGGLEVVHQTKWPDGSFTVELDANSKVKLSGFTPEDTPAANAVKHLIVEPGTDEIALAPQDGEILVLEGTLAPRGGAGAATGSNSTTTKNPAAPPPDKGAGKPADKPADTPSVTVVRVCEKVTIEPLGDSPTEVTISAERLKFVKEALPIICGPPYPEPVDRESHFDVVANLTPRFALRAIKQVLSLPDGVSLAIVSEGTKDSVVVFGNPEKVTGAAKEVCVGEVQIVKIGDTLVAVGQPKADSAAVLKWRETFAKKEEKPAATEKPKPATVEIDVVDGVVTVKSSSEGLAKRNAAGVIDPDVTIGAKKLEKSDLFVVTGPLRKSLLAVATFEAKGEDLPAEIDGCRLYDVGGRLVVSGTTDSQARAVAGKFVMGEPSLLIEAGGRWITEGPQKSGVAIPKLKAL